MSMRDLIMDIQEDLQAEILSFPEIAAKHQVPLSWVNETWEALCSWEHEQGAGYHDELERDHDEAYEPDYADSWYEDQYDLDEPAF